MEIIVAGHPAPQGSKHGRPIYKGKGADRQFTGHVAMQESSKKVAPWRADVRKAFEEQWTEPRIEGAVYVSALFSFYRPMNHYLPANSRRAEPELRPEAPPFPMQKQKNDIDKLIRSTLDAITSCGRVWVDDSYAIGATGWKVYADHPAAAKLQGRSGAIIKVSRLDVRHAAVDPNGYDALPVDDLLERIGF